MRIYKKTSLFLNLMLMLVMLLSVNGLKVNAESGKIYECIINPTYKHPVTGIIEDAGGENSSEIGSGMASGTIYNYGILEKTDSGKNYLTFKLSLIDFTSNHKFQIQKVNDTKWEDVNFEIVGNGSDANGATADISIMVDSQDTIVRCSMKVDPMGRDVIFYFYPSEFKLGNSTDINAVHINETTANEEDEELDSSLETTANSQEKGVALNVDQQKMLDGKTSISSESGLELSTAKNKDKNKDDKKAAQNMKDQNKSFNTTILIFVMGITGLLAVILLVLIIIYMMKVRKRKEELLKQEREYEE